MKFSRKLALTLVLTGSSISAAFSQQSQPAPGTLYSSMELVQINETNKALTRFLLEAAHCEYENVEPTELWARTLSYLRTAPEITSTAFDRMNSEDLAFMLRNKERVALYDATQASLTQVVKSMRATPPACNEIAFKQKTKAMDDTLLASGVEKRLIRLQSLGLTPNF